jgi:carbamoyltransferase
MPEWLRSKLHLNRVLRKALPGYKRRFVFAEHHESHAASAFYPSPFQQAAILTLDGVGEWDTASMGIGRDNRIEQTGALRFPHSLGLLYSAFTYYCGFKVNSGEYKLMGLAPYGKPIYEDLIRGKLVEIKEDGSFRLDMSYFDYCAGLTMTSRKFHDLFGGPPRSPETLLTRKDMDLAASIQAVTEDIVLRMARQVRRETGMANLCLAGGVSLNCVANGRLLREGIFDDIWIQPAAGDAGGALGVALLVWHQLLGKPRTANPGDSMKGALLGPAYGDDDIRRSLDGVGAVYRRHPDDESLVEEVAELLANGKVIGWMQGPMEFGPRALGGRSILGDARNPTMQSVMNLKIKFRESFRPFAPVVLQDKVHEWFDLPVNQPSPYMLLVGQVAQARMRALTEQEAALSGIEMLNTVRSEVPAITHVDGSARVQTVDRDRHGVYHALLERFEQKTGCPVLINTSFNVRGEPIVLSPEHAWNCFVNTHIDTLVIGRFVMHKEEQKVVSGAFDGEYISRFKLD